MGAVVNTKRSTLGSDFLKATANHIRGGTYDYFKSVMPNTERLTADTKRAIQDAGSLIGTSTQAAVQKVHELRSQINVKNIMQWYLDKSNEFDDSGIEDTLELDTDTDDVEFVSAEISESERSANQISKTMIETSMQNVEATMISTANIQVSVDKATAAITTGFEHTTDMLSKILEVVTKNTSTLIETTATAAMNGPSPTESMIAEQQFSLDKYRKIVSKNVTEGELGPLITMLPMLLDTENLKNMITPDGLVKMAISGGMKKFAPNFEENAKALDNAMNETIMTSLIRLGEQRNAAGTTGMLAKIFGIRSEREEASTARTELKVEPTPFDTITKDTINSAIPGYLRQMVMLLGGPDMVYDPRSRSFRTKQEILESTQDQLAQMGTLASAPEAIRGNLKSSEFTNMLYDLMMNDLTGKSGAGGESRATIVDLRDDSEKAKEYVRKLLGNNATRAEKEEADAFAQDLSNALNTSDLAATEFGNQVARNTVRRNQNATEVVRRANEYDVDISEASDTVENAEKAIRRRYGMPEEKMRSRRRKRKQEEEPEIQSTGKGFIGDTLSGVEYANRALYEIYRRLNTGINVFQTGKDDTIRQEPYQWIGDLRPPRDHKPRAIKDANRGSRSKRPDLGGGHQRPKDYQNPLKNNEVKDEKGNVVQEELSGTDRFFRWGKTRGGELAKALFSGSPDDIKNAFGNIVHDVSEVGGAAIHKKASEFNEKNGNPVGYVKHKLFGSEYSYKGDDGETVQIAKNDGVVGFLKKEIEGSMESIKKKSSKWVKTTLDYFNFGGDKEEDGTESKRKKVLSSAAGAFMGAGILGGPIGLLLGGVAGSALSATGIGGKLKKLLFGSDEDGKPTGLINRAADAVISPFRYQIGKTISFAGATLQKHVFGPLSDVGVALRDRITNHVDTIFDHVRDAALAPFKAIGKIIGKGLLAAGRGIAKAAVAVQNTVPGKLVRGAIGSAGAVIGGVQRAGANMIAGGGSYHKLKKDETYEIKAGEMYYDPNEKKKHIAAENMAIKGGEDDIQPRTKDYLKRRRKDRSKAIDESLEDSGYYGSGRGALGKVVGFFGGDYKKWREKDLERRKERRERFKNATSSRQKTPEEIAAEQEAAIREEEKKNREQQEKIAEEQQKTQTDIREDTGKITSEIIPGSSFKTHDQGIHDRLDTMIEILSNGFGVPVEEKTSESAPEVVYRNGRTEPETIVAAASSESRSDSSAIVPQSPKVSAPEVIVRQDDDKTVMSTRSGEEDDDDKNTAFASDNEFANSMMSVFGSIAAADGGANSDEQRILGSAFSEAAKDNSNKAMIISKAQELLDAQADQHLETQEEEKESIWDKILGFLPGIASGISGLLPLVGIAGLIWSAVQGLGGEEIVQRVVTAVDNLKDSYDPDISNVEASRNGVNAALALADTQVDSTLDLVTPGDLYHNQTDGAGNKIKNSAATKAKDQATWMGNTISVATTGKTLGQRFNTWMSERNAAKAAKYEPGSRKAKKYQDKAEAYKEQADSFDETLEGGILNNLGRVGVLTATSSLVGFGVKKGAEALGADEDTAKSFGHLGTAGASAVLIADAATAPLRQKKSVLDKILGAVKGLVGFFAEQLTKRSKLFGKFATKLSSAASSLTAFITKITGAIQRQFTDKVYNKVQAKLAASGIADLSKIGPQQLLTISIGGILGALGGACDTAHLFQVLPDDADALMKIISTFMGTAFGALQGSSFGWVVTIFDILDGLVVAALGTGIKQSIAQLIYKALSGFSSEKLNEKQAKFQESKAKYEEKYLNGEHMSDATYNDMINNSGGIGQRLLHGKTEFNEDGMPVTDEAGVVIKKGGITSWVSGRRKTYAKDAEGNILRDDEGNAVVAVDKNGNEIKADAKWGDKVASWAKGVGRFFTGGETYETDESGQAIRDEKGELVVKERKGNLWNRITGKDKPRNANGKFAGKKVGGGGMKDATADSDKNPSTEVVKSSTQNGTVSDEELMEIATVTMDNTMSLVTDPIVTMQDSMTTWGSKDAPWAKSKGSTQKDRISNWVGDQMGGFWTNFADSISAINELDMASTVGTSNTMNTARRTAQRKTFLDKMRDLISGTARRTTTTTTYTTYGNTVRYGGPVPAYPDDDVAAPAATTTKKNTSGGGNPLNKGFKVSSPYGWRNISGKQEFHSGVDLYPSDGSKDAEVKARFNGRVTSVKTNVPDSVTGLNVKDPHMSTGNSVSFITDDGFTIENFHLKQGSVPSNLKPGTRVSSGQTIGRMGSTGRSSGPHLHYTIRRDGVVDGKGSNTIDPTPSIHGKSLTNTTSTTADTSTADTSVDTTASPEILGVSTDNWNTASTTTEGTSASSFIEQLMEIGNKFLSDITGGLLGSSSTNSSDSSGASYAYDSAFGGGPINADYTTYNGKVQCVEDFIKLCEKEVGTKESPPNSNSVKYNDWFWGKHVSGSDYAWCMAFVQWCFDQAGLPIECRTASCGALLNHYKDKHPECLTKTPKPGDVIIFQFSGKTRPCHTGIVHSVNGSSFITIEGNTTSGTSGDQSNGGCVAKRTNRKMSDVVTFIRVVDFDALKAAIQLKNTGAVDAEGAEALWKYFKSKGYNDIAISGILGCWTKESNLVAKRIEGDYKSSFPGHEKLMADQRAMDDWAINGLGKKGKSGYMLDGHYYPGIGFAQWTKGRAKGLVDFAKSRGSQWYRPATQLEFFEQELKDPYYAPVRPEELNKSSTPAEAAKRFTSRYEGYNVAEGVQERQAVAQSLYSQYRGKFTATTLAQESTNTNPVGGPVEEDDTPTSLTWSPEEKRRILNEMAEAEFDSNDEPLGDPVSTEDIADVKETTSSVSIDQKLPDLKTSSSNVGGPITPVRPAPVHRSKPTPPPSDTTTAIVHRSSRSTPTSNRIGAPTSDLPLDITDQSLSSISMVNNPEVLKVLGEILLELRLIVGNTGDASKLLDDLNGKDFGGTTDVVASGTGRKVRNTSSRPDSARTSSPANTRMINSLIRP